MSDVDDSPLDCEPVNAVPDADAAPDDTIDAEVLDDDAPMDPDAIQVDVQVPPGTEVDLRDPAVPPQDPNEILDAELDADQPVPDGHQTEHDGTRPAGGSGGPPRPDGKGGGGFSGKVKRKRGIPGLKGRGGGSGDNVLFKSEKHIHRTVNLPGANIGNGASVVRSGPVASPVFGRRPPAGRRRPIP